MSQITCSSVKNNNNNNNNNSNKQQSSINSEYEEDNKEIINSIFEMNRINVDALPSVHEIKENEFECINVMKKGYENFDEPSPTYVCKDSIFLQNQIIDATTVPQLKEDLTTITEEQEYFKHFKLLNHVKEQAEHSLTYLYLPDSNSKLKDMSFLSSSQENTNTPNQLKKYKPIYDMLLKTFKLDSYLYFAMVGNTIDNESKYFKTKLDFMRNELNYRGIDLPHIQERKYHKDDNLKEENKQLEHVYCKGKDFVIKLVETKSELIEVIKTVCESFMPDPLNERTMNTIQNEYPVKSNNFDWVFVRDEISGEIACAGQVYYNRNTMYAGAYNLGTKEKFRGKGFATYMMIMFLELAKFRGYKKLVLQASEAGFPIYLRLGFDYRFDLQIIELYPLNASSSNNSNEDHDKAKDN
ncbi:hypothetical protein ABK040_003244 [Willaertia magna]